MKNLRPILILAGVGVIGYSLYRYYTKQINFLKNITYKVIGLKINSISASQISLDITTKIFNASNVEATVKEMYLDILINGVRVGQVNEVKDILILPSKSSDISFNFAFSPRLIGQNIVELLTSSVLSKDVVIDINGYVRVKSSFISTTLPFEYKNNIKNILKK